MMLETERCLVKPISINDKNDLLCLCDDPNVWQYLGGNETAERNRKNIEYIDKIIIADRWVVKKKTDNLFLGEISLTPHHDGEDIEISYLFLSMHWGKGYASETAKEIIHYAFDVKKLDRLVAETQSVNFASCKVLEKLGFCQIKKLVRFNVEQTFWAINITT
jgi:ribosomal-protein-alanine N-acetyltransferase